MTFTALMQIKDRRLNNVDFIQYWLGELKYWKSILINNSLTENIQSGENRRIDRLERIACCDDNINTLVAELIS